MTVCRQSENDDRSHCELDADDVSRVSLEQNQRDQSDDRRVGPAQRDANDDRFGEHAERERVLEHEK